MTISNETVSVSHNGNASTSLFAISGISFTDNADIDVYIRDVGESPPTEALKTITTHYFMTDGSGNQTNPATHVKFDTGSGHSIPAADQKVVIKRKIDLTQSTDYVSGASFSADSHESALDKLTLLIQQMQEQINRTWLFPETYLRDTPYQMPEPGNNAVIRWNSDGSALISDLSLATAAYKVSPSADDSTADYLEEKLKPGTGLSATTANPGGDEEYTFSIDSTVTTLTGTQTLTNKRLNSPKLNEDVAVTTTATELNILDGNTGASTVTLADVDRLIVNDGGDGGTMKQVALTAFETYFESALDTLSNVTTVGALDAGSITSNFGNINIGTSSSVTAGSAVINSTIGHTDDTDLMTLADGSLTVKGTVTVGVDDTGHDVKFFGAESGSHLLWDESDNSLETAGNATINVVKDKLLIGGTAVTTTATELNLLDGVSGLAQSDFIKLAAVDSTANELNLLDGSAKSTSSITIADDDAFIVIDGTTTKQIPASDISAYAGGGGGAGSIDTLFTMQAKSESAAYTAIGNAYVWSGDTGGSLTNATLALETTAADLIQSDKVFAYDAGGDSSENWWYHEKVIQPGYGGKNMVLQLQYYTRNGADGESFRFYARNASKPIFTSTGSADGSNTVAGVVTWDASLPVGEKQAAAVGDRVVLFDTSNAIHYRYITAVSATTTTADASLTITYSGADIAAANSKIMLVGVMSDELDYLPANDVTANEAKVYRKQMAFDAGCTLFQFGFLCTDTDTDVELYYDDIALSANQFLQTSSRGQSEQYHLNYFTAAAEHSLYSASTPITNTIDKLGRVNNTSAADGGFYFVATQRVKVDFNYWARLSTGSGYNALVKCAESYWNTGYSFDESYWDNLRLAVVEEETGYVRSVAASTILEPGEVIGIMRDDTDAPLVSGTPNWASGVSIVAEPLVNDVVLLNSQDEIFTDWVDYTPGNLGSGSNWNVSTNVKFSWRRIGGDMEIRGFFTIASGGATSYNAYVGLPSGYTIDQGSLNGTSKRDFVGSWVCPTSGTVDYYGGTNGIAGVFFTTTTDSSNIYFSRQGSSATELGLMAANAIGASNSVSLTAKVPIAGWTSTFNPVLSMPLVDFGSFENTYSARIFADTSGISVTSESSPFIHEVSRASAGKYTVTWKSGFFGVSPVVVSSLLAPTGSNVEITEVEEVTTAKVDIEVWRDDAGSTGNNAFDAPFFIMVQRQGSDYRQPPQPTAAVIKPAVAVVKDVKAYNANGGTSAGGGWQTRTLNTIDGESWFVSLNSGNNGFTLDPGAYEINAQAPGQYCNAFWIQLYSNTNSAMASEPGQVANSQVDGGQWSANLSIPYLAVTSAEEFAIHQYTGRAQSNNGLGIQGGVSGYDSVYTTVQIRKLK